MYLFNTLLRMTSWIMLFQLASMTLSAVACAGDPCAQPYSKFKVEILAMDLPVVLGTVFFVQMNAPVRSVEFNLVYLEVYQALLMLFVRTKEFSHSLIPYKSKLERLKEDHSNMTMNFEVCTTFGRIELDKMCSEMVAF
jgi:hypothetical protein